MSNPILSVCFIVKNEKARLPLILKDVSQFADEIIVVDTGSTDGTAEIAASHGAKVSQFVWCDDFAAARNASLNAASGKWILWLDADDRISLDEGRAIKSLVVESTPSNAFTLEIINTSADGRPSSFLQLRLFPNDKRLRFEGRIHESVAAAAKKARFNITPAGIKIIHTGYETAAARAQKMERNMALLIRELEKEPNNISHRYLIAGSLAVDGRMEEAVLHYEKIAANPGAYEQQADVLVRSLVALAKWNNQSGRFAAGEQWARKAVSYRDNDMEAQYELARALTGRGDIRFAYEAVHAGLSCQPYISSVVVDFICVRAALYELALQLANHAQKHLEAGEWLRKGIEELPYSPEMVRVAAQYYVMIKRNDLAKTVYKHAISRMGELKGDFEKAITEIDASEKSSGRSQFHPEFVRTLPVENWGAVLVVGYVDSSLYSELKRRGATRIDGVGGGAFCSRDFRTPFEAEKSDVRYGAVIFGNALEESCIPHEMVTSLVKVMASGASAFFTVRNLQHFSVFSTISYGLLNSSVSPVKGGRMYTKDSAISLIEKCGLRVTTVIDLLDPLYQQQVVRDSAKSMNLGKALLDLEGLTAEQAKDFFAVNYFFHARLSSNLNKVVEGMNLSVKPSTVKAKTLEEEGKQLLDNGDYNGAAGKFLELINIQPEKANGYSYLGLTEWYQGNTRDAYFLFKNAASIDPFDSDILLNLWDAALKTDNTNEARKILEAAVKQKPELIEIKAALVKHSGGLD
ncbi:MAG: glycosyltransferase [Fibrobacteres bacterium]|nr:glycosyltransferase [Fibrobacterota bacterium]